MNEMTAMQQSIFELERIYTKMKQQYDDEIRRLRQELDERDSGSARKTGLGNDGGPPPSIPVANRNYSMGQQAPGFSGIGISAASRSYSTQPSLLSVRDMTNFLDKDPRQKYEIQGQKGGPQLNMRHRDSIPGGISLNPVKGPLPHPTGLDYRHSPYQQRPPPLHGPGPQMAPRAVFFT